MSGLKIVMVASEMTPFAKTGGLADVVGALPRALAARGNEVMVIMPKYNSINADMALFHSPMGVWMGGAQEWCSVYKSMTGDVPVYLIEHNNYFGRDGLYNDSYMNEYGDNPKRFSFLSRAAMQFCIDMNYSPDVFHCNDWQTSLIPYYLSTWNFAGTPIERSSSVLTIHNMAYQGNFSTESLGYMGINYRDFTFDKFEQHGRINMLKGGIHYADAVNTVSPTYAREVTSGQGYGLDLKLLEKGDRFFGILNGADYSVWNPETDRKIKARYSKDDMRGKWLCKGSLQECMSLETNYTSPVFGIVGRFTSQKGYNLVAAIAEKLMEETSIQLAVVGSGDKDLEGHFSWLASKYHGRFGCYIGFNDKLAHIVEAGSDFFLMPSLFEPCGLNQIYSLKYGTLPIVRNTGGLSDTVENCNEELRTGTGFKFNEFTPEALYGTIMWVLHLYRTRPDLMEIMRRNAMSADFSWDRSAGEYEKMYETATGR